MRVIHGGPFCGQCVAVNEQLFYVAVTGSFTYEYQGSIMLQKQSVLGVRPSNHY